MLPDEQREILRVVLDDLSPPNHLLLSWLLEHMTHIIDKVSTISVFFSLFLLPHCFYKLQKFVFSSFPKFFFTPKFSSEAVVCMYYTYPLKTMYMCVVYICNTSFSLSLSLCVCLQSAVNRMTLPNMVIVFSPTLQLPAHFLHTLYNHRYSLFGDVQLKRYNYTYCVCVCACQCDSKQYCTHTIISVGKLLYCVCCS